MIQPTSDVTTLKIGYIGGGSRGWAQMLMNDLAKEPRLGGEVVLYDIDVSAAHLNERFGKWIQQQPGIASFWNYRTAETIEDALRGADVVIISIQPGSLSLMAHEIAVAERYGRYFPVGDTVGVPGLMRGLRAAQSYAGFAHCMSEICPNAWVINYTNPMTICTRTLTKIEPNLKVFGCCHEVFGTQALLAEVARKQLKLDRLPHRSEIEVSVLGINHFTWIDRANFCGHDLLNLLREYMALEGVRRVYSADEVIARNDWFVDVHQVKFALFERYGILPAAGDRHLCEFLPGLVNSPEELYRWGVIRTPVEWRMNRYVQAAKRVNDCLSGKEPFILGESGEETVKQICALVGHDSFVTNVNMANSGQISNLPVDIVVETNACFSRDSVEPIASGALPLGVFSLVSKHVLNQELIIDAALSFDNDLAFQAVFNDPATSLSIDKVWHLINDIGFPWKDPILK